MSPHPNQNATQPLRVLISAGEASGEMYGAQLISALRAIHGGAIECFGLGGERMREAGCELVVDARDVAVVGLFEVLSHLPAIYGRFRQLLAEVDRRHPHVAVLIDFPDWNLRLAAQLHRRGIPVVYYVSPQLWAWRKWRLKLVQRYVRKMLVILPFERDFYAKHGVQVEFVGHPLSELDPPRCTREEFAARWGLDPSRQWIALLPGSRRKELQMNLAPMLQAAATLGPAFEFMLPVASTLDRQWVQAQIDSAEARTFGGEALPSNNRVQPKLTDDARATLLHARVAAVASGTATLEAALIGTPFVMVYRVSPLTWALGRRLVKLPYYGIVNLIVGREAAAELIQERFTAAAVASQWKLLLQHGPARERMLDAFVELRDLLRPAPAQQESAAERAAQTVLRVAENG
jgi:lipid-A-disaccharide synthase